MHVSIHHPLLCCIDTSLCLYSFCTSSLHARSFIRKFFHWLFPCANAYFVQVLTIPFPILLYTRAPPLISMNTKCVTHVYKQKVAYNKYCCGCGYKDLFVKDHACKEMDWIHVKIKVSAYKCQTCGRSFELKKKMNS